MGMSIARVERYGVRCLSDRNTLYFWALYQCRLSYHSVFQYASVVFYEILEFMKTTFFILGSHPAISIAEIHAVLKQRGIRWVPVLQSDEVLLLDIDDNAPIDIAWFGGVVKIGFIVNHGALRHTDGVEELLPKSGGGVFGWSVYRGLAGIADATLTREQEKLSQASMAWKRDHEKSGHIRIVIGLTPALSSVVVEKNHLLQKGKECVWIVCSDVVWMGYTTAVQEFEEYGMRDRGRPGHDAKSGMLPPKLAKMMVNVAVCSSGDVEKAPVILDPFCGSGTILQEALLLGYNVIGADKSPSAIKDSKKNLAWLTKHYPLLPTHYTLIQSDVRKLARNVPVHSVDAIITEPYLGPALRTTPTDAELRPVVQMLTQLYTDAFKQFEEVVKSGGRVCIIFPVFVLGSTRKVFLSASVLPNIQWNVVSPDVHPLTSQGMLLYGRPGQKVWREIGIFTRTLKH